MTNAWRARLREAVARSGRKHAAIAWDARIAEGTLSRILTGAHAHPRMETIAAIAHACGETVGWVLGERGYTFSAFEVDRLQEAASIIQEVTGTTEE